MTDTAIQKTQPQGLEAWQGKLDLIKQTVAKGATDTELELFLYTCNRTGLDPLARQIYAIKRGAQMTIQTGIDGYRLIAERTGKYAGQEGPWWCGDDGIWRDVWLNDKPPAAAKISVLRNDFEKPLTAVAVFKKYSAGQNLWLKMPDVMIAKVAEALALRRAFPQDLSGLYTAEEMDQADNGTIMPTPQPVQHRTPARQPAKAAAKVEDVMCSQCGGINSHTDDCPTKQPKQAPKQAEGQVLEPEKSDNKFRANFYVEKITDSVTGSKAKYQTLTGIIRGRTDKIRIQIFHASLRENTGLLKGNWVDIEVTGKPKPSNPSETMYALENIFGCEDENGYTPWKDGKPAPEDVTQHGVPAGEVFGDTP